MEGDIRVLAHSIETSSRHTAEMVSAMRDDMRQVRQSMDEIRGEQVKFRAHSEGLQRLDAKIDELRNDFREHAVEDRKTADSVTKFKGGLVAIWAVFGVLAAVSTAYINERFNNGSQARSALEARIAKLEARP